MQIFMIFSLALQNFILDDIIPSYIFFFYSVEKGPIEIKDIVLGQGSPFDINNIFAGN